ncbi:MAG: DUF2961 domain-containing protein [Armatimonadetes bacterium]|nr:DUF2961 domain-containing protein [Armatimonadota bacterium]
MTKKALFVFLCVALCAGAWAQSPLDGMSKLKEYRAMRASSSDPNWEHGNGDARPIEPGQTLTLAELQGPGRIVHIWFTIAHNERFYGKLLVLRMYWDGEKNPSVECPVNDFFCEGHGADMYVNSLPFRVTSEGRARNCYWPMPFAKSAKITVTNEGTKRCDAFYYYIDWQKLPKLSEDEAYFHAQYRQEFPCVKGRDYLILEAEGKGHYVGCNLSVRQREPGWWGEGDDRFYIDGETVPSIQGTGSEDYFCDGWGIRKLDGLYYGFPISEGYETNSRHTCYRFHIQDPVPFNKSIKVVIEHKGARRMPDGKWNGYVERFDDFSSVAYWYQREPHKPFPPLPGPKERLYSADSLFIEGESLVDSVEAVGPEPFNQPLDGWSGGAHLFFTPFELPASIKLKFNVPKAGKYAVTVQLTKSWDYGVYQAYLNGAPGPTVDLYSDKVMLAPILNLGTHNLSEGQHEIKFEAKSKNSASSGYYFGLDFIELIPE